MNEILFKKYELSVLDIAFLLELYDELKRINEDYAHEMIIKSSILTHLETNPDFVHHNGV